MKITLASLSLIFTLTNWPAFASEGIRAVDGDTIALRIRIENIDTPEIKGQCDYERDLAFKAKAFTQALLDEGQVVVKQAQKRPVDRYGRMLARVEVNGQDLGERLIKEGLARPWTGKREPWCP